MWRGDQPTTATTLSRDPDKRLTPSVRVAIDEVSGGGGTFPPCVARVLVDDGLCIPVDRPLAKYPPPLQKSAGRWLCTRPIPSRSSTQDGYPPRAQAQTPELPAVTTSHRRDGAMPKGFTASRAYIPVSTTRFHTQQQLCCWR